MRLSPTFAMEKKFPSTTRATIVEPMPVMTRVPRSRFVDGLIRVLNRARQCYCARRDAFEPVCANVRHGPGLAEVVENRIDTDLAGQFSGLLSAHAVADDKNPVRKSYPKLSSLFLRTRPISVLPAAWISNS